MEQSHGSKVFERLTPSFYEIEGRREKFNTRKGNNL